VSNFCEHCQGQRFDRARVLRALRQVRGELRHNGGDRTSDAALAMALKAVLGLEIPHLAPEEEEDQVVH
jgi:hypothetical protein